MKDNYNVPCTHPWCAFAETGRSDWDDFDHPLGKFDPIPEGAEMVIVTSKLEEDRLEGQYLETKKELPSQFETPSTVRTEPSITVIVPAGEHPIDFLKEMGVDLEHSWVFMNAQVVETIRKNPLRYTQSTVAYGEFFRFESYDTISLQRVEYFPEWRVLLKWEFNGEKFERTETPKNIIEVVMEDS